MYFALFISCLFSVLVLARAAIAPAPDSLQFHDLLKPQKALHQPDSDPTVKLSSEEKQRKRADAVKDAFKFAWDGYFSECKGSDELNPVSNTCGNSRNHWGASAVDALSTALVMDLKPVVDDILDFVSTIDFTTTDSQVSLFETTIRYLGGLLSGYDLLKGPLSHLAADNSTQAVDKLLSQAKILADTLKFAFDTPSGIPVNDVNIKTHGNDGATTNGLARVGTLVLEWQRLSDLSGNPVYGDLAAKAESHLLDPKPAYNVPYPGLVGTEISLSDGTFQDARGGWNGGDDSYYEYLIKMLVYNSTLTDYRDRWVLAADSTIKYLKSNPSTRPDLTFLASYDNHTLTNKSQHLTCFDGGNFLLGGQALKRQDYIDFGLELVNGCHATYASTLTHIGPEEFSWDVSALKAEDDKAFFAENGFYITNGFYDLRPEVIESYYYAYRITGDTKYQDWAWDAFRAINATCRVNKGFSSITDVNAAHGGEFNDEQESFIFAEVLKYSYLIHAPDAAFQVASGKEGKNEFVFNTEAHPVRVARPPA